MQDYEAQTIRDLRADFPLNFAAYLDEEIMLAYSAYCEIHYAAGWTKVDIKEFVGWAFGNQIDQFRRKVNKVV